MTEKEKNEIRFGTLNEIKISVEKLANEFKTLPPETKKAVMQDVQHTIKMTQERLENRP